jgi:hypothetical protein
MIFLKKQFTTLFTIIFSISFIVGLYSCNDDLISSDPKYRLEFSTDSLSFDTVFTTLGSATSKIVLYNRNKVGLNISSIKIKNGSTSFFKINVDGSKSATNEFKNIEIRPNDSLYIFVAVTIDPNNANSPLFIEDSLNFITNSVKKSIKLKAYGQDMELFSNKLIKNDTTLTADKPYLIYGNLTVDSAKTLTLNPGCRLYFHNNANLIVHGNLKAEGTADKPITLRGDRLDDIKFSTPVPYNNVAGQWGGVYLLWEHGNHTLNHVNMNSGYVGINFVNTRNSIPQLQISDCKIHNFLLYGLMTQNGNVTVTNTEISNSSSYCVFLNGGNHSFTHCTIANYFDNSNVQAISRDKNPALMIMNLKLTVPMENTFKNCIISGSAENEFSFASTTMDQYKGTFDHCYIRTSTAKDLSMFTNIRWYEKNDILFKSTSYDYTKKTYFNFTPDSLSPARGLADKAVATLFPIDLNGKNRLTDGAPDAGAHEWTPTK